MEAVRIGGPDHRFPLLEVAPPGVVLRVRAPVQRAADDVVAAQRHVRVVVAARLRNVNLPAARPRPVRVVDRKHPDRRPQPGARRQPRRHLDAPVPDRRARPRVDACRPDRVDDGAVGGVGAADACGPQVRVEGGGVGGAAAVSVTIVLVLVSVSVAVVRGLTEQVDRRVLRNERGVLQCGLEVQDVILDKGVFVCAGCLLELSVSARLSAKQ